MCIQSLHCSIRGADFSHPLGRYPLRSIQLIDELSLYHCVFSVIPSEVAAKFSRQAAPTTHSLAAASILHAFLNPPGFLHVPAVHPYLLSAISTDPSCTPRLYLAAALTPYSGITYRNKKNKTLSAVDFVIRESLKLGTQNHYLDGVPQLFAAAQLLKNPNLADQKFKTPSQRVAIGKSCNVRTTVAIHTSVQACFCATK